MKYLRTIVFCVLCFSLFFYTCTTDYPIETGNQVMTVAILSPLNGSQILIDSSYVVLVEVKNNKSAPLVEFYIDSIKVGADSISPYQYTWNTTGILGDHSIMARSSDALGNVVFSSIIIVKVVASIINNPPMAPSNPSPYDGAAGISTSSSLSWSCTDPEGDAITYDIFFGTTNPPTTQVGTRQITASLKRDSLSYSTNYYWMVKARDAKDDSTIGPVWSFRTGSGIISQGMIHVDGGIFTAGSTPVTISSFKIDKYEVTYELWTDVLTWALTHGYTDLPAGEKAYNPDSLNSPISKVNWFDVVKWCNARSEKEGSTPVYYTDNTQSTIYRIGETALNIDAVKWDANGYRLPTETEWEFAARGGNSTHGYTYSGNNTIEDVAWYSSNSGDTIHIVGTKSANELGIYDMSGNTWEWCWDWYSSSYPSGGTTDPKGPSSTQTFRLLRGGSFGRIEYDCRVNSRGVDIPNLRYSTFGFRCVRK